MRKRLALMFVVVLAAIAVVPASAGPEELATDYTAAVLETADDN